MYPYLEDSYFYPSAITNCVSDIFILIAPFLSTSSRISNIQLVLFSRNLLQKLLLVFGSIARANRRGHGRARFTSSRLKAHDPPLSSCCFTYATMRILLLSFTLLLFFLLCLWISARDRRRRQAPLTINPLIDEGLIASNYPRSGRGDEKEESRWEGEGRKGRLSFVWKFDEIVLIKSNGNCI